MDHLAVESSTIASVGYDPLTQILELEFTSAEVYHYYWVPEGVYAELVAAESKGRYFNAHVRDRFRFVRL